ncbi:MAG: ABC transporter permease [Deltaproteobacteria bacterium]|nr:ABC transporter permease [Deltaproteobacteria bacterium]
MSDCKKKLKRPVSGSKTADLIAAIGSLVVFLINEIGAMALFMFGGLRAMVNFTSQISKILRQIAAIGYGSLFLIILIGLFTGMVIGLQGYHTLSQFGSTGFLGSAVALSLIRELAPVLTAIMVTGRAGSAMSAEIGVMRITDQIDALEVMNINPMNFLIAPRLTASLISFPLLTSLFAVVGIFGGYITGVLLLDMSSGIYFSRINSSVVWGDVLGCLVKAVVFAILVVTVCCYKGFFVHLRLDGKGAEAVGNATTSAVVLSCILILIFDYVITSFHM